MPQTTVPLYPDSYPAVIPDERKEQCDERGCIRNVHYPTLTVYQPEKPNGSAA